MQEFCVKKKDRVETVTMLGVYGFLVTAIEVYPCYCFLLLGYCLLPNTNYSNLTCFSVL